MHMAEAERRSHFDQEIIDRVKQIDLLTYLREHDPTNLVKLSNNTYCTRNHDSLKISNGKWYWFSRGFGGHDALTYLYKVEGIPFPKAVQILLGDYGMEFQRVWEQSETSSKKLLIPPLSDKTYNIRRYLRRRGIDPEIIDYGIRESMIFETEDYHNVLFVGYDPKGIARYAAARSTFTHFKGDLTGSDKRFSFCFTGTDGSDLHLFEAAIGIPPPAIEISLIIGLHRCIATRASIDRVT